MYGIPIDAHMKYQQDHIDSVEHTDEEPMNREDLISEYAALVVDGMDLETVYMYAIDKIREDLRTYSDEDLEEEVREYYPHLLGDDNE